MSTCPHEIIERHYDRPRISMPKSEVYIVRASLVAQRLLMGERLFKYMFEDHVLLLDETLLHGVRLWGRSAPEGLRRRGSRLESSRRSYGGSSGTSGRASWLRPSATLPPALP